MRSTISCERDHDFRRPETALFERHELDKTHDNVLFAGETGETLDLVVVESAQKHAIDFERRKSRSARGANALEHHRKAARDPRDPFKDRRIHGVHAHRHPVEPGRFERARERLQQMAVGGESKVERLACRRAHARQFLAPAQRPRAARAALRR